MNKKKLSVITLFIASMFVVGGIAAFVAKFQFEVPSSVTVTINDFLGQLFWDDACGGKLIVTVNEFTAALVAKLRI